MNETAGLDEKKLVERADKPLSSQRAKEICNGLVRANNELAAKRKDVRGDLKRWALGCFGLYFPDMEVGVKFRGKDDSEDIRQLFLNGSDLLEGAAFNEAKSDVKRREALDGYVRDRANILANLAEILVRTGLTRPVDVKKNKEGNFEIGRVYKLHIGMKEVFATCAGFTTAEGYMNERDKLYGANVPFFELNGRKLGDKVNRISALTYKKVKAVESVKRFCGYDQSGRKVFRKEGLGIE